jgi:hypothetical protein
MTLAEDLCTKYGLTSLKIGGGGRLSLMAINEALEAAAQVADRKQALEVANEIRSLKWEAIDPAPFPGVQDAQNVA